ncbi:MAG: Hsp20/alpha crystallin family protein [Deltaproteobacteria bacterium]|nr:Hsp20/alpha crystallin family protein [Deltaproteobacteria bacterium]
MTLERWHPLRELESMKREMDKIWEDLFIPRREPWKRQPETAGTVSPAIDIIDRESEVLVKAEMPGVAREDIDISMNDSTLSIKGELKTETEARENYAYSERNYRYFARSISIPFKISPDKIKASLKDGILYIHMPKTQEAQPRKIQVEVL